ncbi:hypothetical protein [Micromonospora halophytica]|uniref:Uncharacterized protein n=1 Tax=Micromonospora halophytica TaxID=47864 RepID=A0A1C5HSB6_9ACTN|nr:hypothetical protein [Micromonospora halophytica]SCG48890.1 hypothetical protein GA0070560_105326 [Micromonospora halophytica]
MSNARLRRSRPARRFVGLLTLGAATAVGLAGCGGSEPTDFDTFIERHRCEKLVRGSDGDIDLSCVDPQTGQRVDIEFEANDRAGQYFTDTQFGGIVHVFSHDEVRDSNIYPKTKKG